MFDTTDEFTIIYNGVKLTFLNYPFQVIPDIDLKIMKSVNPLVIASMKAYALGRRAKWKDYVDLYFISQLFSISEIITKAKFIFGTLFSEKQFRTQLCYFNDVDLTEKIEYIVGKEIAEQEIKKHLRYLATQI